MGCVSSKKGEDGPGMGKPCPDQQNQQNQPHYVKDPTTGNPTASKSVSNHSHSSDNEEYQLLNCKMQFRNITVISCYLMTVKSKMSSDDTGTEKNMKACTCWVAWKGKCIYLHRFRYVNMLLEDVDSCN